MAKAKSKKITIEEALVPVEEQEYNIPNNWIWIYQNFVCQLANGEKMSGEEYPYLEVKYLRGDTDAEIKDSGRFITANTKVILVDGENSGEVFEVLEDGYMGSTFKALNISEMVNEKYLLYYVDSKRELLKKNKTGSAIPHLNKRLFLGLGFPLPPLPEQQRIVEQIEGLFSKLDEVKEKIECLLDSKKVRCNSVLNKAFTGKLTAKWRENNNIKFETWEYINFEKIIVEGPQNGMYKPKTSYGSGTKILRIDCFYDGKLEPWEKLKRLEITDEEKHTYLLSVNDIVVNRVNSMPYLGKSALIRKLPEQCVFESNMMRIKINIRKANPEYVIRYLNSSIGLQELRKNAKQAVNQASINQQDVKMVKIALPSLEEQNEIVKIITSISNKDEAILNKAEAVIEEIDLMKKSILAKAFRGELGTNISKEKNSIEVLKKLIEEKSK
jgi:type I restriction enzyme S subunit